VWWSDSVVGLEEVQLSVTELKPGSGGALTRALGPIDGCQSEDGAIERERGIGVVDS
jgi:hypothetical protein